MRTYVRHKKRMTVVSAPFSPPFEYGEGAASTPRILLNTIIHTAY